jgi:hypothetical protein
MVAADRQRGDSDEAGVVDCVVSPRGTTVAKTQRQRLPGVGPVTAVTSPR